MSLSLTPYLMLNGTAQEAMDTYCKIFGAEVQFTETYGNLPENPAAPMPEEMKKRILHATIKIGDSMLMFSDTSPDQPTQMGNHVTICVTIKTVDQTKQIFEGLLDGGETVMPLQETFFSPMYGIVKDKFGVSFQLYTEKCCEQ